MSTIQERLGELRQAPGVKGTAMVTEEGLMVAHSLDERFRDDVVAGLTSFLLSTVSRCLADGRMGSMTSFVLQATHGKVVFTELEAAFLVVVLDQFADLSASRSEIRVTAQHLRRLSRMTSQ